MDKGELKKLILATLAEKGDYTTILQHLSAEEKQEKESDKSDKLTKLITPISAFADLLTENSKGAFMEDLTARLDDTTKKGLKELTEAIEAHKEALQTELRSVLEANKSELIEGHLTRYREAETKLTEQMMQLAVETVVARSEELLPDISAQAKLTPEEVDDIIDAAALAVESQVSDIIGDYVAEHGLTSDQITDFAERVQSLIPAVDFSKAQIQWSQIVGVPQQSQGGTNINIVRQLIDEAIAAIPPADGLPDQTGNSGKFLTTDGTDASWATLAGGGDMAAATYDPQAIAADAFDTDNHTDGTTNKVYTATEKTKLAGIEESADVTDAGNVGSVNAAAASKTTPVDADSFPIVNSESANAIGRVTFTNLKAFLKTYFDTLYQAAGTYLSNLVEDTTPQLGGNLDLNGNLVGAASAADLTKLSELTASSTELNYVDGVTSAVQTQLDAKAPVASPTFTGTVTVPATNFTVGASTPFSDTAGTLTLQNVDAIDATTEATIETALDTLANLTSIQGRTVTLADAGADAIFGWDDSASAYENLTQAEVLAIIGDAAADGSTKGVAAFAAADFNASAGVISIDYTNGQKASTTQAGLLTEIAIASEVDTGTDTARAISPDALAGSTIFGRKTVSIQVTDGTTDVTTGDGKAYITIPEALNGMNLVRAQATVVTAGTTNATTVMVHNKTDAADMLSGAISIASAGTVGTVGTINGSADDVATNDVLRIDVDSVSTTAPKGLMVVLEFQLP